MTGCNHTRYEQFFHLEEGDKFAKGFEIHELAEQLGLGHFEVIYGIVPWLFYSKALGLDTEALVGMPTDVRSVEWWIRLLKMIAYRQGFGDQLAEGLRRTVEKLGKAKYGDAMYTGPEAARGMDHPSGKEVTLPIATLFAWGYTCRSLGFEMPFPMNMPSNLNWMIDTRDPHHNKWPDWAHQEFGAFVMKSMMKQEDPYTSEFPLRWAKLSNIRGTIIDCLPVCFMFPLRKYMGWQFEGKEVGEGTWTTAVESRIFSAVTGIQRSEEEFFQDGERVNTLFRAIQIRDHARTAQMEFNEIIESTHGTYNAEKFKVTTGNFYEYMGWDRETGWPTREHLESLDLKDVADELEALGKLPKSLSVPA
jgi:aldehyde:ferredoxin oxidoreductase